MQSSTNQGVVDNGAVQENGGAHSSPFSENPLFGQAMLSGQSFPGSTLYIVGLPIGNAADITLRALWILSVADVVACEDTRETRKLLDRYGIRTPTVAVHEHNERSAAQKLVQKLSDGARVALVTDAGTPGVSDPGAKAVDEVRKAGFNVVPVPGASAVVTALSASGLDSYTFTFVGFVPPSSKARKNALSEYSARSDAFVLYEAPHRIRELLCDLADALDPQRKVVVARELTKRFESFYAMTAGELAEWAKSHEPRGEYAVLVDSAPAKTEGITPEAMKWARILSAELPASRAAAVVAKATGAKRDEVYRFIMELG